MLEKVKLNIGDIIGNREILSCSKRGRRKVYTIRCVECNQISVKRKEEFLTHKCLCTKNKNNKIQKNFKINSKEVLEKLKNSYKVLCSLCNKIDFQTRKQLIENKCFCQKYSNKYEIGKIYNGRIFVGYTDNCLDKSCGKKYREALVKCISCGDEAIGSIHSLGCNSCLRCSSITKGMKARVDPWVKQFNGLKNGAKHRAIEVTMSFDDFVKKAQSDCYYCGEAPSQKLDIKYDSVLRRNGIDRINSKFGYSEENTVACCFLHNRLKSDLDIGQFFIGCLTAIFGKDIITEIDINKCNQIIKEIIQKYG